MPNEINTTTINTNTFFCDCCCETLTTSLISRESFENDDSVCQDCLDANYRYSERRDYYVHNDNWNTEDHDYEEEEEQEDNDSNVQNYTARVSTKRRKKDYEISNDHILFCGI